MTSHKISDIIPLYDIYDHHYDLSCACLPYLDDFSGCRIHNSYDAREFEQAYPDEDWFYVLPYTPSRYSH